jgi:hypothetical protein
MKFLTTVLLVIQLSLPAYGPGYFFALLDAVGTSHTGFVCADGNADSDREAQDDQQQNAHCRELDAPCDLPSRLALGHPYAIASLTTSHTGTVLSGHGDPLEIPPEHRALFILAEYA